MKSSGSACTRNANNDAVDCATATQILIPDGAVYGFSVRGSANGTDSVRSHNVFKKNPGAGGLCLSSACADPVPGVKVTLKNSKGQVLVTGLSDEDGWYLFNYKWAGKPSTFYVTLKTTTDYTETKTIILKANAYAQVDFLVP